MAEMFDPSIASSARNWRPCPPQREIKAAIVSVTNGNDRERALLNFGHTVGHAIERAGAIGISPRRGVSLALCRLRISVVKAGLPESDRENLIGTLRAFELRRLCCRISRRKKS